MPAFARLRVVLVAVGFVCAFLATGRAAAAPNVTGSYPSKVRLDNWPGSIRVHGTGFLPAGITQCSDDVVNKRTIFLYRTEAGHGFEKADIIFPAGGPGGGCGDTAIVGHHFFHQTPNMVQVQVVVDGVASNLYTIPVVPNPITAAPHINSLSTSEGVVGQQDTWVKAYGTNIPGDVKVRFQGQYVATNQSLTEVGWVSFKVPHDKFTKPFRYSVQLENGKGYSNIVWFDVIQKPQITKITPGVLPRSAFANGSPPVQMTVYHSGSVPKVVEVTLVNTLFTVSGFVSKPGYVQFPLALAGRAIPTGVAIRIANTAGQHKVSVPVAALAIAKPSP